MKKSHLPKMFVLCIVVIVVNAQSVESSCGKSSVDVSDAILACPLNMDVSKTRHSIVIARFVNRIRKETVLSCSWNGKACPHCVSISGWELLGDLTRHVLAKVPTSKLHNDSSYTCQMVPPESEDPHNDCQVISISLQGHGIDELLTTDLPDTLPTTDKSGPSTAADELNASTPQTTTIKPKASTPHNRDVQTRAENHEGPNGVLLFQTVTMICLQVLILAVLALIFIQRRYMIEKSPQNKGRNLKGLQETSSCNTISNKGGKEKTDIYSSRCTNGGPAFVWECAEAVGDALVDVTSDKGEMNNMGITLTRHATVEKYPEARELLQREQI